MQYGSTGWHKVGKHLKMCKKKFSVSCWIHFPHFRQRGPPAVHARGHFLCCAQSAIHSIRVNMNYNDIMLDRVNIFAARTFVKVIVQVRQFCQTLCVLIEE